MTERGLPTSDGAPACPFVAFEDDRDERATSPDHRHRCYAEPNPAPRALAHQEAYCLSSAFPVCPTFQDWARREAARSRGDSIGVGDSSGGSAAEPVQRNPPRNWQAPPPWMSNASGEPGEEIDDRWERDEGDVPPIVVGAAEPEYLDDDEEDEANVEVPARGRGLSGSYADRVAAGGDAASAAAASAAAAGAAGVGFGMQGATDDEAEPPAPAARDAQAWGESTGAYEAAPIRPRRERDPERMAAFTESRSTPAAAAPPSKGERRRDPKAPEWESGRRLEAYPTLRARRLPELSVPPILVSVIALALAAAVLFALPGLLGFGNPGGAVATPTRGAGASSTPLTSLAPTPVPQATQRTYTVKKGDTLSSIAGRFNLTLDELIAANTEAIPDPDKLAVGDVLIIPTGESDEVPSEN